MRRLTLLALLVATPLSATAQQPSPIARPNQVQVLPLARLSYAEACVRPGQKVVFEGAGLPPQQGARRLAAQTNAGFVDLTVASWSATKIGVTIPAHPRLAAGASLPVGIVESGGTWGTRSDRPLVLCGAGPVVQPGAVQPGVVLARPGVLAPPPGAQSPGGQQPAPAPKPAEPKPAEEPRPPEPKPAEPAPAPPAPVGTPPEAPCPERLPPPPAFAVTCPLVMTGTGLDIPPPPPFTPMRFRTDPLIMHSVGAAVTRPPFAPVHLRTESLLMSGASSP